MVEYPSGSGGGCWRASDSGKLGIALAPGYGESSCCCSNVRCAGCICKVGDKGTELLLLVHQKEATLLRTQAEVVELVVRRPNIDVGGTAAVSKVTIGGIC